jgi:uncharacterized RDD family membrane protein YckC
MMTPELFDGVLPRRVVAFIIDLLIIAIPLVAASMFIFVLGLLTFAWAGRYFGCCRRLRWCGRWSITA